MQAGLLPDLREYARTFGLGERHMALLFLYLTRKPAE